MWQNHIKIAIRNFRRQPFFSTINVLGLGAGLAACWLLIMYVVHENSYDQFLPHTDRICAVALDLKMGDQEGHTTNTPPPVGPRMLADYPEIEQTARTFDLGAVVVKSEQEGHAPIVVNEDDAIAADTAFLEMFGFPMAEGDAQTALDKPGSVVVTEEVASIYFGQTNVIGKQLNINDRLFTITGILKNFPKNSTVKFDFAMPIADYKVVSRFEWSWVWLQVDTWVKLRQPATPAVVAALEAKFPEMVHRYAPAAFERIGQNFDAQMSRGDRYNLQLMPLKSLHLDAAGLDSRLTTLGDRDQVNTFGIVGCLILLLACVNFMNLSTARSMKRAKEVGVRKALGSQRSVLISQFITESLLTSVFGMVLACGIVMVALPYFNQLTDLEWTISDLFAGKTLALTAILPCVTGLLGGLYPAFYLSRFSPFEVFKLDKLSSKGGNAWVRSGLVVFQFTVSVALMLGVWTVYRQLDYAQHQLPGLQRENVLVVENARLLPDASAKETFRQQALQLPEVMNASHSTFLPSMGSFGDFYEPEQGEQPNAVVQNLPISSFMTDDAFVPSLGIEIKEGRNFMPQSTVDSSSVILNETAVKAIGWQNPIGKWMRYPGNQNQRFQVVGIMRDFHHNSVKTPIEPVAIFHESSKTYRTWGTYFAIRLKPGTEKQAIEKLSALWAKMVPGAPFESDFLDASFARIYRSEAKTGAVLGVFTALALLIGCLGLFALAAFTAEQRTKEIGIRKVLGASVMSITGQLAANFLKLVIIAILIATPLSWYVMNKWLANYIYAVSIPWWMFVVTGVGAILIAFLTVGAQSVKAALVNPVKSLKSE